MKTLKLMVGMLLITASLFAQADSSLNDNEYAYAFIPADAEIDQRGGNRGLYLCDEDENMISSKRNKKTSDSRYSIPCTIYYSRSTDTSWLVTFAMNPGTPARVRKISKIEKNGQKELVAEFNPRTTAIVYANPEARKFASAKGRFNNTETAKNDDGYRKDNTTKDAVKIDAKDLINGVGALIRGIR